MAKPVVMPSLGMYTEEGTLTAWLRPTGTRVEAGEAIAEITTEKVTLEIPSPASGILHHIGAIGVSLHVEAVLGYILADGEALPTTAANRNTLPSERGDGRQKSSATQTQEGSRTGGPLRVSPAARKLAAQHGIDLHQVKGSGPGGRIVEADILARVSQEQA